MYNQVHPFFKKRWAKYEVCSKIISSKPTTHSVVQAIVTLFLIQQLSLTHSIQTHYCMQPLQYCIPSLKGPCVQDRTSFLLLTWLYVYINIGILKLLLFCSFSLLFFLGVPQRPVLRANEHKKTGACSARARSAAKTTELSFSKFSVNCPRMLQKNRLNL